MTPPNRLPVTIALPTPPAGPQGAVDYDKLTHKRTGELAAWQN